MAWSSVCGTVWEGVGGVALLEEVCHWDGLCSFKRLKELPVSFFVPCGCPQEISSQQLLWHYACRPAVVPLAMIVMDSNSLKL